MLLEITSGLAKLHKKDQCHGQLKSSNLFLVEGRIVLGDLGLPRSEKVGMMPVQSLYYAAPEVLRDGPYTIKSDIWSLGCILYELLTLHTPFKAPDVNTLFRKVIKSKFEDPPETFPDCLNQLVRNMLKVNAHDRIKCEAILNSKDLYRAIKFFKLDFRAGFEFMWDLDPAMVTLMKSFGRAIDSSPKHNKSPTLISLTGESPKHSSTTGSPKHGMSPKHFDKRRDSMTIIETLVVNQTGDEEPATSDRIPRWLQTLKHRKQIKLTKVNDSNPLLRENARVERPSESMREYIRQLVKKRLNKKLKDAGIGTEESPRDWVRIPSIKP
jgi:serine/threonine protein kinase